MVPKATPPVEPNSRKPKASRSGIAPLLKDLREVFHLVLGVLRFLWKFSKRPATPDSVKVALDEKTAPLATPAPVAKISRKHYLMGLWSAFFVTWGIYLMVGVVGAVLYPLYPFPNDPPLTKPPTPVPNSEIVALVVYLVLLLIVLPAFLLVGAFLSGAVTSYFWGNDLSYKEEERAKKKAIGLVLTPTFLPPLGMCLLSLYQRQWLMVLCVVFLYVAFAWVPVIFYSGIYGDSLDANRGFWLERKNKDKGAENI